MSAAARLRAIFQGEDAAAGRGAQLGCVTLRPPVHLLVGNRAAFRDEIRRAFAAGAGIVAVDFAGPTYADSSGLGMLLAEKRRASGAGQDLVLLNVGGEMGEMLRLTRLDRAFAAAGDISLPGDGA